MVQADLSDEVQARALAAEAATAVGPLTLLVNNASVFEDDRAGALGRATWALHMETNLRAPVVLAEAFAGRASPGAEGLIVNLLDQRVFKPNPQFFSYSLSKHALWAATRMLAQELAPRIRVNGIGPGPHPALDPPDRGRVRRRGGQHAAAAARHARGDRPGAALPDRRRGGHRPDDRGRRRPAPGLAHARHRGGLEMSETASPTDPRVTCLKVFVRGLKLDAEIGVHAHEHGRTQPLLIDAELELDLEGAHELSDTYDYTRVVEHARAVAHESHVKLAEDFAERLARRCLQGSARVVRPGAGGEARGPGAPTPPPQARRSRSCERDIAVA